MDAEKRLERLRNYLSPVINFFSIDEQLNFKMPANQKRALYKVLESERKKIYELIPKIRKILNEETAKDLPKCSCIKHKGWSDSRYCPVHE